MASPPAAGALIHGHPWTVDWRDTVPVEPLYLSAGDHDLALTIAQPTGWNPYQGLQQSFPVIPGYGDPAQLQALTIGERLEAGSYQAWPTHGQLGLNSEVPIVDLAEEAGVDVGAQLATYAYPMMGFVPPPSYAAQTTTIPAYGV